MNKQEFINALQSNLKLSKKDCIIINDILEKNFIFNKKNKNKIINDLQIKLSIDEISAIEIYNFSIEIISSSLKEKIKHPFKSKEN